MALGTAAEEQKKSDTLWESLNIKSLREQQDKDLGLWGPHEFKMPKEEGKWESVTTNSAKILANKIMGLLASSWLQLFIDEGEGNKKSRKKITNTEQLANGCIWLSDREAISVPSGKKLQAALSTYAVLRGGTAVSVYWFTDDEGNPHCSIGKYDPTFCQWIEGESELLWFCYRNYVTKEFIQRAYRKQLEDGFSYGNPDAYGRVLTYTFWDDQEWKVSINGNYVDAGKHGLGYLPVNIRSCGTAPYIQSANYMDTMKYSWTSCFANNRDIYDLESKLLSIEASKAIESGKIKIAGEWDSSRSNNKPPEGLEKLGYGSKTRNEIVLFDAAKGQKFGGMVTPPSNEVVDQFLDRVRGMDIIGSIDPIAFGQMTRSGSGALAAELRAAALEFIYPFRECVQDTIIWIAEEIVKQFKNDKFKEVSLEGRDRKREKFRIKLKPEDVKEAYFDCDLVPDKLRDKIQELGAAIQQVSYGLTSKRTARLQHNIVDDPDREQDIMDEELAAQDPLFRFKKMAKYFIDEGDDEMALAYDAIARLAAQRLMQQVTAESMMNEMMPEEGGEPKPPVVSPQMQTGQIANQPQMGV